MGEKAKIFGMSVGAFVLMIALIFVLGAVGVAYKKLYKPMHENIEREVFEETQSFVHGKIQDLAKYKREYDATDDMIERQAIQELINQQFAQFDSSKVKDPNLRNFLVNARGF